MALFNVPHCKGIEKRIDMQQYLTALSVLFSTINSLV